MPLCLQAQITAPLSSATRYTGYPVTARNDKIFVFCASASSATGTLIAESPGGTAPFNFEWLKFDETPATQGFNIPVKTESGTISSFDAPEGGYGVHITDNYGYDVSYYAWVHIDVPVVNAALKNYTCSYVALDGTTATDDFYYYDPSTGASVKLPNELADPIWTSSPSSVIPPNEEDPIIGIPPLVDVTYMLQVTDSFGCASSSSFFYESIHVDAAFTAAPSEGDAPLEVAFTNTSVRANTYLWDFGDDSVSYLADPPAHKYYIPGDYTVTLTIESELFCSDIYSLNIKVNKSAMEMPNVFSPNGDGINDYFVPDFASLKYVSIKIFSKSGQRVYHYEGNGEKVSEWTGWDGKINNSDRFAEPGIYYYVITGKGWDDKDYKGSGYRGIVYLYR